MKKVSRRGSHAVYWVFLFGMAITSPASADAGSDIVNGIFGVLNMSAARSRWESVDPDVRTCLTNKGLDFNDAIRKGVTPTDSRVAGYVRRCEDIVAQQREQKQAAEAQARTQAAAREAQAKAASAAKEAKRKSVTAKYEPKVAEAVLAGKVTNGMTKAQVLDAKGTPSSKEVITPNDELWTYGDEQIVFTEGQVTYIGR